MTAARNKSYRHHIAVITAIMVIASSSYVISYDAGIMDIDMVVDILFTDMLDVVYAAHEVLSLTATDSISNNNALELNGVWAINIFESGTDTFAIVAAFTDDGVQILNITDPSNIIPAGRINNTPNLELDGARGIATFKSGGHTYAAVAANVDDGVQILNVTDPSSITAAGSITDAGNNNDDLELNGAYGIAIFESGGHTYAAVAANVDDGVQILNITDPSNITAAGSITDTTGSTGLELDGARGITTFKSGTDTYAAVAANVDDGIQILNITDPYNITAAYSIKDGGALALDGISPIITFNSTGGIYIATAELLTFQILNITDLSNITLAGNITDTDDLEINGVRGMTTFESGDHVYIATAANSDDGVQILDVTDPSNIIPAGNIEDDGILTGSIELDGAIDIATFNSNGNTYAAVAAYTDQGVQIIRIDIAERDDMSTDITPPVIILEGSNLVTITVGGMYTERGAVCDDDVDADKQATVGGDPVDTSTPRQYTVTYDCTDSSNNEATQVTRTVNVKAPPPTFVSSELDTVTRVLTITFSETIDATPTTNIDPTKIHIRESGNYTGGGITMTAGELGTTADASTISFTLTELRLATVTGLVTPELTIEPGAVRDTSGNLIVGTFDLSTATFADVTFPVSDQETKPQGMAFSNDGTKMFVVGNAGEDVNEYTLRTPFDISTAAFANVTFAVSTQYEIPRSMAFSNDGTKMFVVGGAEAVIHEYTLPHSFNLTSAAFVDSFSVLSQELEPRGMAFSNDGTKMFVVGSAGEDVNEYTLRTPFDISTAAFADVVFDVSAQDGYPTGMAFSNDGTKMFVVDDNGVDISEYTLITPFSISTAASTNVTFSVSGQDQNPTGMAFSNDGTKMFVVGLTGQDINEYTLSPVYPIRLPDTKSPVITLAGSNPATITVGDMYYDAGATCDDNVDASLVLTPSGTVDTSTVGSYVLTYSCTDTAGNVATQVKRTVNVKALPPTFVSSELDPTTMVLTITFSETINATNVDAAKIHIRESGNYTGGGITMIAGELGTTADASTISFILTAPRLATVTGLTTPELTIEPGAVQGIFGNLIVGTFDVSTATFDKVTFPITRDIFPAGMAFSNDGTKMFVVGANGEDIHEYALPTPFTVSTVTHVASLSVSSPSTLPRGIAFSNDGAKMFIVDDAAGNIREYALPTPFTVSTARYVDSLYIFGQEEKPRGMAFSNDGAKMFVVGNDGNDINEYTLFPPFNITSATFADVTFDVSGQDREPQGMAFSNDGTKMFVVGSTGDSIYEYTLITPFNLTTATYDGIDEKFSVMTQELVPQGMAFSNDGAKMFVVGSHGNEVNQYTLSSVYPITVTDPTVGAFITTWKTTTTDKSITLPLEGSGMTVNWGDGNTTAASGSVSHTYGTAGDYTIQITGDLTRFHLNDAADASKLVSLDQWGTASWASMKNAFSGASNMVYNATDSPDLSSVTDMSGMLAGASSFNGDLSSWGVSSVTDMNGMFFLATSFNGDISSWDVSSVTDMSDMFSSSSSFNGNLSSWDVSSVDDMLNMFTGATSFNGNISGWDVSSVTDMSLMFNSAFDFNQPLSSWDVSSVTDMSNMFNFASDFNQPLSSWDVSSVENMSNMFRDASSFNGNISGWDVSSVTSMSTMFAFAASFDQNLGNWYVVPADTTYDTTEGTLNVTTISAQNTRLDGHSLSYGIDSGDSGDSNLFNITDSNTLMFKSTPFAGTYNVNVTASGTDVFSNGNNWRLLEIRVTGQTSDSTSPPTFVSSELHGTTRVLTITFSETIDATNIDPTKIHIRESGTYSGGITMTAGELGTTTDASTISFTLTRTHLDTVAGLATPELTIEPGAVQDTSGNLIVSTFDVSTASYDDDEKFSVSDQESSPLGMAFSNDGAKMFVVGNTENNVNEYDLSTPFDVSTATFVHLFNVTGQGTISISMAFSNNGAKMFVLDFTGYIDEYTLSTPFDVSTASYDGINERFDVSGQDSSPQDVAFSNDGTKMLVLGAAGIDINEYTLSTPFDVSTASYAGDTERFSVLSEEVLPSGMAFSNDGAKMFVVGFNAKYINKYTLSTPFDVSTAIFAGNDERLRISGQDSSPQGMVFSNDGTKMFVVGNDGDDINEYTLSSVYPVTVTGHPPPPTFVSSDLDTATRVLTITFSETIDVTPKTNVVAAKIHIRESGTNSSGVTLTTDELDTAANSDTITFNLTESHHTTVAKMTTPELTIEPGAVQNIFGSLIVGTFDVSTANFTNVVFPVSDQEENPLGMAFSNDGAKMFVVGSQRDHINEYTLSTPFDVSTATFAGNGERFYVGGRESGPTGMAFSNDGAKMFVVGVGTRSVNEYDLSTPFDVSTATHNSSLSVSGQEVSPTGMAFSNDGGKMFVVGFGAQYINGYTLSTPFDVSTSSAGDIERFYVGGQDSSPQGMAFSNDGAKMFMVGRSNDYINEYTLSTPFDVSTASYAGGDERFYVGGQDGIPTGMAFSNDGAKMFVVGFNGEDINEYTLSSLYPIRVHYTTPPLTDEAFATTWRTTDTDKSITLRLVGSGMTVNWGDGNTTTVSTSGSVSYTYSTAVDYTIQITGGLTGFSLSSADASKLVSLDQWGTASWTTMENAFLRTTNMVYNADDTPDLSGVASMKNMFSRASSFNGTISGWAVSSVTDMSNMFWGASDFNQPLSGWDVSSVTNMDSMFRDASSFNGTLSGWDVSLVTSMSYMLDGASSFNQPLSGWDVSSVRAMNEMFALASSFNQPLSSWDVSSVTRMGDMFSGASLFDQNLGNWYVVPADTAYAISEGTLIVTTISAQNTALNDQIPVYGIGSGSNNNSNLFNITNSKTLMFKSTPSTGIHTVNVTASDGRVFEDGNNWRLLEIRVTDQTTDTTPPSISEAVAASLNSITVTFSENVDADATTDGSHWSLGGADAGSLTVSANTDPAGSSNSMTLTLSGDLPDTRPDLSLIYTKPTTGGITDGTNQLEGETVTVIDGIAPTVTGARAASGTAVTLTLSEDVSDASATPGDFSLSGVASSPTVSSISVSGKTVTLTLSSAIVTSDLCSRTPVPPAPYRTSRTIRLPTFRRWQWTRQLTSRRLP